MFPYYDYDGFSSDDLSPTTTETSPKMENGTLGDPNVVTGDSNTTDPCAYSTLDQPLVRGVFIFAYLFVFGCCCGGNFLLLIVVGVHPAMRTVTNFFLANLAAADLLVALFCVVQNLMHLFVFEQALWPLGAFMCQMYVFVMHLIPCTSAGLLLVLSVERYVAIMHPIAARRLLTKGRLAVTTAIVWLISVVTNVPYYMAADYQEHPELVNVSLDSNGTEWVLEPKPGAETLAWCGRSHRGIIPQKIMFALSFAVWYVLPFLAMLAIYSVIGVALWRSTNSDSVALTSSSGTGGTSGGCAQHCAGRVAKRRSRGESVSRQISSTAMSSATTRLDSPSRAEETEMISFSQSPEDVWRKKSEEENGIRNGRKSLTVAKATNGRQQPHSGGGGSDPRVSPDARSSPPDALYDSHLSYVNIFLASISNIYISGGHRKSETCYSSFSQYHLSVRRSHIAQSSTPPLQCLVATETSL